MKQLREEIYWLHPHFYNWMGGHKYILEVITRLKRDYGFQVTLITDGMTPAARQKFEAINVPIITLTGFSTNSPFYWIALPLFITGTYHFLTKIKHINQEAIFISSMFPTNRVATLLGHKTLQLCYEPFAFFYDQSFLAGFSKPYQTFAKLMKFLYQKLDQHSVQQMKAVATLSSYNQNWIKEAYGVESEVVYEGVDLNFFQNRNNPTLAMKYQDKAVVFHSTDYTPIKGTEYLLKAIPEVLKRVPHLQVIISETLPNSPQKAEILKQVKALNLEDVIEFAGFLEYQLLPEYLSLAQVVVQPSINQSMNLTVKEAMACETPVITSPEGNEQTLNGEAGFLVEPRSTSTLANTIVECISDTKLNRRLGKKGRQIVIQRFSWESVTQKIVDILDARFYAK